MLESVNQQQCHVFSSAVNFELPTIDNTRIAPLRFGYYRQRLNLGLTLEPFQLTGPDYWNINKRWRLCSLGQKQSPIDVRTERLVYDHLLGPLRLSWLQVAGSSSSGELLADEQDQEEGGGEGDEPSSSAVAEGNGNKYSSGSSVSGGEQQPSGEPATEMSQQQQQQQVSGAVN